MYHKKIARWLISKIPKLKVNNILTSYGYKIGSVIESQFCRTHRDKDTTTCLSSVFVKLR